MEFLVLVLVGVIYALVERHSKTAIKLAVLEEKQNTKKQGKSNKNKKKHWA